MSCVLFPDSLTGGWYIQLDNDPFSFTLIHDR